MKIQVVHKMILVYKDQVDIVKDPFSDLESENVKISFTIDFRWKNIFTSVYLYTQLLVHKNPLE